MEPFDAEDGTAMPDGCPVCDPHQGWQGVSYETRLLIHIRHTVDRSAQTQEDVLATLADVQAQLDSLAAGVDTLITTAKDSAAADLDTVSTALAAIQAKVDAANAPPAPPAPAPAPEPPPEPAPPPAP